MSMGRTFFHFISSGFISFFAQTKLSRDEFIKAKRERHTKELFNKSLQFHFDLVNCGADVSLLSIENAITTFPLSSICQYNLLLYNLLRSYHSANSTVPIFERISKLCEN
jgi:hypothetical protein